MSNRIEDYTDEELVLHYRDMQHLSVDASTKEGLDYLRYYQRLVREMARRFAELIESNEEDQMSDNGIKAIMQDDGTFKAYDDTYDITIHCESKEEQDKVKEILNQKSISKEDLNKIIAEMRSRLDGVNITLDVLVENDPLTPKMEAAKTTLEECLSIIVKYAQKEAADDREQ